MASVNRSVGRPPTSVGVSWVVLAGRSRSCGQALADVIARGVVDLAGLAGFGIIYAQQPLLISIARRSSRERPQPDDVCQLVTLSVETSSGVSIEAANTSQR